MGIQESKVVIDALSAAHDIAIRNRSEHIQVKLEDQFLESLRSLWSKLTAPQRSSITNKESAEKRKNPIGRGESVTNIDHETLMRKVEHWSVSLTPLDFFTEGRSKLDLTDNALKGVTEYMQKIENASGYNSVRMRLLQAICHRCKERLSVNNLSRSGAERLIQIVSQSGIVNPASSKQIIDWVDQGNRIQDICQEIGCNNQTGTRHLANLFFCDQVYDTTISRLPLQKNKEKAKDGPTRQDLVERIRQCSDRVSKEKRKKLEDFTHSLFETIWKGVEKVIHSSEWEMHSITTFQQSCQATVPSLLSVSSPENPQSTEPSPSAISSSSTMRSSSVAEPSLLAHYDEAHCSSGVHGVIDAQNPSAPYRKKRRILETQSTPAAIMNPVSSLTTSHQSFQPPRDDTEDDFTAPLEPNLPSPYHIFNPRQHGQLAVSVDLGAQRTFPMPLEPNLLASYDTFNPRQHGQLAMSLDPGTQGALAVPSESESSSIYDAFLPTSLDEPATQSASAIRLESHGQYVQESSASDHFARARNNDTEYTSMAILRNIEVHS